MGFCLRIPAACLDFQRFRITIASRPFTPTNLTIYSRNGRFTHESDDLLTKRTIYSRNGRFTHEHDDLLTNMTIYSRNGRRRVDWTEERIGL